MYELTYRHHSLATPKQVWAVWADLTSYPAWDPREEVTRLDGPLAAGTTGFSKQVGRRPGGPFTIVRVDPGHRWTNESPLPGGKLVIDHLLESASSGGTDITKTYRVHGPMSVAFRLVFARGIGASMPSTFAALDTEIRRRTEVEA
jgi:hypothetical protein